MKLLRKRDNQLEVANDKLGEIGLEHKKALKRLRRRDNQLEVANDKLDEIGLEHEQALAQLAKYERVSQFPPIRLVINGVRKGARMLSGRTHEH